MVFLLSKLSETLKIKDFLCKEILEVCQTVGNKGAFLGPEGTAVNEQSPFSLKPGQQKAVALNMVCCYNTSKFIERITDIPLDEDTKIEQKES